MVQEGFRLGCVHDRSAVEDEDGPEYQQDDATDDETGVQPNSPMIELMSEWTYKGSCGGNK
jgi:hypothetical protein